MDGFITLVAYLIVFSPIWVPILIYFKYKSWKAKKAAQRQRAIQYEAELAEKRRTEFRDASYQMKPYTYQIGRHANETLALRYGIANLERKGSKIFDAKKINLQKTKKVRENVYLVQISDFRNRKAIAVIEPGTEYVKTFLPLSDDWFEEYEELELVLKGNKTMLLSEIAKFHIEKTVKSKRR